MDKTLTIQEDKLKKAVSYALKNSPFYQRHFAGILNPDSTFEFDDFKKLPVTLKQDIADNNAAFLCVPLNQVAEYVTTSGTSGNPITIYLTRNDLLRLAENERASLELMGGSSSDIYQLLTTMDKQFMAGLAYYLGIQKMQASIIRIGPGSIPAQWASILQNKPTKLISVPTFILKLLDYADEHGIDYKKSSIDSIVCIGEPIRDNEFNYNILGKKITERWDVELYSTYASTEMATAFSECKYGNGGHLNPDLVYLEVLKEDGTQAKNGEAGEIIITPLGVEGTPLIRYNTGDIAIYWDEPCRCGKHTPRLGPIIGRKNQLIKFKGTSLYPQAIFNTLNALEFVDLYQIVAEEQELTTNKLRILLPEGSITAKQIEEAKLVLRANLKVTPEIELVEGNELRRRVFNPDNRKPNFIVFE